MEQETLSEKLVLISGGGSGMGRATALAVAREGGIPVIFSRRGDVCAAVRDEIIAQGGKAHAYTADVGDLSSMDALGDQLKADLGHLDGAFFNAGAIQAGAPLHAVEPKDYEAMMAANLDGLYYSFRITVPLMPEGGGPIVVTSSVAALKGRPYVAPYTAAKWGGLGMALSTAAELGPQGIRVNIIAPGYIGTDAWMAMLGDQAEDLAKAVPLRRIGVPEEVADTVLWLLSDASRYITGAIIPIDGGLAIQ